jgi:hypothetical protein
MREPTAAEAATVEVKGSPGAAGAATTAVGAVVVTNFWMMALVPSLSYTMSSYFSRPELHMSF